MIAKELRYTQQVVHLEDLCAEVTIVILALTGGHFLQTQQNSHHGSGAGATDKVKELVNGLATEDFNALEDYDRNQPSVERVV